MKMIPARLLPAILLLLLHPSITSAFYDPGPQRWLNRDPLGEAGFRSLNLVGQSSMRPLPQHGDTAYEAAYTFNYDDPLNRSDAWGLTPKPGDLKWCSKALKLLKKYKTLCQDLGCCIPQSRLDKLNAKRDAGTITSNDLPATLRREFPSCFEGMPLSEIQEFCGD